MRAVRAARAALPAVDLLLGLPVDAPFLTGFVDFVAFLALLAAGTLCCEAGGAAAPVVLCPATGDTVNNAASTPESQRAASGLEFGEFTTLIYLLYADFAARRRWESLPLPFCAPLWKRKM
jgi:hypothetical protein